MRAISSVLLNSWNISRILRSIFYLIFLFPFFFVVCKHYYCCSGCIRGATWRSWLRHFAISRKAEDWNLEEVNGFISIYIFLPTALWPRKEYQESSLIKVRPALKADNLTAIWEPTVQNSRIQSFIFKHPRCNFSSTLNPQNCWCLI
jgi:hypothetical protein